MRLSGVFPVAFNQAEINVLTQLANSYGISMNTAYGIYALATVYNMTIAQSGGAITQYDIGAVLGMNASQVDTWMASHPGDSMAVPYTTVKQLVNAVIPGTDWQGYPTAYLPGYGYIVDASSTNYASGMDNLDSVESMGVAPIYYWQTGYPIGTDVVFFKQDGAKVSMTVTAQDNGTFSDYLTALAPIFAAGAAFLAVGSAVGSAVSQQAGAGAVVAQQAAAPVVTATVTPVAAGSAISDAQFTASLGTVASGAGSALTSAVAQAAPSSTGGILSDLTTASGALKTTAGVIGAGTAIENAISKPKISTPAIATNYGVATNTSSMLSSLLLPALVVGGAYLYSRRK